MLMLKQRTYFPPSLKIFFKHLEKQ